MDVQMMKGLLQEKKQSEIDLARAAKASGIDVMPSPNLRAGKPLLMVSPEVYYAAFQPKTEVHTKGPET